MDLLNPNIHPSWKPLLEAEFSLPYFQKLLSFLKTEQTKYTIFPDSKDIFRAFSLCSFDGVKVVILGQDPYHGKGQAHGLAFSVNENSALPPSLRNILQELHDDMGIEKAHKGDLSAWAKEGVLLINTVLTVRANEPHSHQNRGWEQFTDKIITALSQNKEHLVFILWGKPAQLKKKLIDADKHLILEAPHPSPLSSYRGFFGSKPFSKTNHYLIEHGLSPIRW